MCRKSPELVLLGKRSMPKPASMPFIEDILLVSRWMEVKGFLMLLNAESNGTLAQSHLDL